MQGSLFRDIHFVANDPPRHSNALSACLINWNIYAKSFFDLYKLYPFNQFFHFIYNKIY